MAALDGATLAALLTALTGVFVALASRRRTRAEAEVDEAGAAETLTRSALALVDPLRSQVAHLQAVHAAVEAELVALRREVGRLAEENARLALGVQRLRHQVQSLGQSPVFTPAEKGEG